MHFWASFILGKLQNIDQKKVKELETNDINKSHNFKSPL